MGRLLFRWVAIVSGAIALAVLSTIWVVYTAPNRLASLILTVASINFIDWWFATLMGILVLWQFLRRALGRTKHREALAVLAEVWALSPDVRLGQLLAHLDFLSEAHLGKGLGDIEDDELIAILYRHRVELTAHLKGATNPELQPVGTATSVSGSPTHPQPAKGA